jgi:hypothetical protein
MRSHEQGAILMGRHVTVAGKARRVLAKQERLLEAVREWVVVRWDRAPVDAAHEIVGVELASAMFEFFDAERGD